MSTVRGLVDQAGMNRRSVLQAGGLVAAAGVVAACSTGGDATSSDAAATSGADEAASGGQVTSPNSPIASVADVPVGGGVIIEEPPIVVTQPAEGEFKAFTAICPHQGCLVSQVENNEILCPCHGSLFSASDGSVIEGPARQGLTPAGVAVDGGSVVLS